VSAIFDDRGGAIRASAWDRFGHFNGSTSGNGQLQLKSNGADGIDIAIRYGRVGATPGTQLFDETTVPVCGPELLRKTKLPLRTPADLRRHTLLQSVVPPSSGMLTDWGNWLRAVGLPALQPASMLTFTSYTDAIGAALAGQGVALGRRPLIDELLRNRRLVVPFKDKLASTHGYFLLVEPGARDQPGVHALEQWVLEQAGTGTSPRP
jgi:DNA-binding transcriptional LysR family regulator